MNRYSTEEKQQAIDLYFKNGCNMKKTVRELGYGSATGILRWLRETVPDKVSKPVQRNWNVDYPEEIKQAAVIDLCEASGDGCNQLHGRFTEINKEILFPGWC